MLARLFASIAADFPEAEAVAGAGGRLTYRELDALSNRLARVLRARGAQHETIVAVSMNRVPELLVVLLAVLKTGAAYLPLDKEYPADRLGFMLEAAGVGLLVGDEAAMQRFPVAQLAGLMTFCTDSEWDALAAESDGAIAGVAHDDQLAYVMYTSGSTGVPKGVGVGHKAIVRLVREANYLPFAERLRIAQTSNISFDAATFEIWGALLNGGCVCLIEKEVLLEPAKFAQRALELGVDTLFLTTALFNSYASFGLDALRRLRHLLFGGERADPKAVRRVLNACAGVTRVIHVYGPTENTTFSTWYPLETLADDAASVPIGRPISGTSVLVLDEYLDIVPKGVVGELFVGGIGLARGYFKQAQISAESFVAHPYSPRGERLYRTGDLVKWLPNGNLDYVGRVDRQVKLRGFRIELGEIEKALLALPAVHEALALVHEEAGQRQLVAYIGGDAAALPRDELRAALRHSLPDYMVPAHFVVLPALPLNANGKIATERLPPPGSGVDAPLGYVAPGTRKETILADIWAEVLHRERIGIHDNFFDLGGDSLLALQVKAQASQCGVEFELSDLFEHQTVHRVALTARDAASARSVAIAPFSLLTPADTSRLPEDIEDAYPLSRLQLGMLFHGSYDNDAALYHVVMSSTLEAPFVADAMRRVLAHLAGRHAILRTRFDLTRFSEAMQLVQRCAEIPLEVLDLSSIAFNDAVAEFRRWEANEVQCSFDIESAPLLRVFVHIISAERFQLTLSFHHAIMDGWSDASMVTELVRCYLAALRGEAQAAEPLGARYADYIALERAALRSTESEAYWLRSLAGYVPSENLRAARLADTTVNRPSRLHAEIAVSGETSARLIRFASESKVALKSVLLAAHLYACAVANGGSDVMTGLVTNGRMEVVDGEKVLGLFLNTVPFRFTLRDETWADLVRRVSLTELNLLAHRRFPLPDILARVGLRGPLESVFNYTNFHVYAALGEERDKLTIANIAGDTSFPLQINFEPREGHIFGVLSGLSPRYDLDALQRYARCHEQVLCAIADNPLAPAAGPDLLSDAEREQLLATEQDSATDTVESNWLKLIELHVSSHPDADALIDVHTRLSYAAMNARANRLAHRLIAAGVGAEQRVALVLSRSVDVIVAALAVMKSGAAYVPIDIAYPRERIALLLADSAPACVLTDAATAHALAPLADLRTLCLDDAEFAASVAVQSASNPTDAERRTALSPQHIAYVIYTSGSTGRPKGVAVPHAGACDLARSMREHMALTRESRVAQLASIAFDASVFEWLMATSVGAALVTVPSEKIAGVALSKFLNDSGATHALITPSVLASLEPDSVQSLRTIVVGGEASSPELVRQWSARVRMVNAYGPTETTVCVAMHSIPPGSADVAIGRAVRGNRLYVLDAALRPLPVGYVGELYVAGKSLARGYLGRPDLTAERFIANPYGPPGERMYRTGDRVRWRADDCLEYIGRADDQVKLRGLRIELGEIEAVLERHPDVAKAIAAVRRGTASDAQLIAFVLPASDRAFNAARLRTYLAEHVPSYMIPQRIAPVAEFPLTSNGKIDRRVLCEKERDTVLRRKIVAPRTANERKLAALWRELLKLDEVSIHDAFHDVGGNSLTAVVLAARIERGFGTKLAISSIYALGSIAAICAAIERGAHSGTQPMVALASGRDGAKNVFLLPPGSGESSCYVAFARALAPAANVFGLQTTESGTVRLRQAPTLVQRAAEYRAAIQQVQPHGPYHLAGWSIGGVIAWEVAQQLEAAGETIARLLIVDSALVEPEVPYAAIAEEILAAEGAEVERLLQSVESLDDVKAELNAVVPDHAADADGEFDALLGVYRRMHLLHWIALAAHTPGTLACDVVYAIALHSGSGSEREARIATFAERCGGVFETYEIDATHENILGGTAAQRLAALFEGEEAK